MKRALTALGQWLSRHYEKLVLIVLLMGLLGSATYLVLAVGQMRLSIQQQDWTRAEAAAREVEPLDVTVLEGKMRALRECPARGVGERSLLVSPLRVSCVSCGKPIDYRAEVCPFCSARQPPVPDPEKMDSDGDGLPDSYETRVGLSPINPLDAGADRDGDGFSNLEEFLAGTDPGNAEDYPSPVAKLRLLAIKVQPFKLRFQGVSRLPNGEVRYLLNLRTLEKSYFVSEGDEVEGFKVAEYREDIREGPYGPVDRSELVLEKGAERIRLVKNELRTEHERIAALVFLITNERFTVRVGDVFELRERKYKVVDIAEDRVRIRDVESGKEAAVGRMAEGEGVGLRSRPGEEPGPRGGEPEASAASVGEGGVPNPQPVPLEGVGP